MELPINYLAVVIAAVASMVLGFIWYNPIMFGKKWMAEKGYTEEQLKIEQKGMGKYYAISLVLSLITAWILACVVGFSRAYYQSSGGVLTGLIPGFLMWLGFIMPVQATNEIFGEKKWVLFGINTGYQLVCMLIMGVIIASELP